jgi:hypothetical protein
MRKNLVSVFLLILKSYGMIAEPSLELLENVNDNINPQRYITKEENLLERVNDNMAIWRSVWDLDSSSIKASNTLIAKINNRKKDVNIAKKIYENEKKEEYKQELFLAFSFLKNNGVADNILDVENINSIQQVMDDILDKVFESLNRVIKYYVEQENVEKDYKESFEKAIEFYGRLMNNLRKFSFYFDRKSYFTNQGHLNEVFSILLKLNTNRIYGQILFEYLYLIIFSYSKCKSVVVNDNCKNISLTEVAKKNIFAILEKNHLNNKQVNILKMLYNNNLYELHDKFIEDYDNYRRMVDCTDDNICIVYNKIEERLLRVEIENNHLIDLKDYEEDIDFTPRPFYKLFIKNPLMKPSEFDGINFIIVMNYIMKPMWKEIDNYHDDFYKRKPSTDNVLWFSGFMASLLKKDRLIYNYHKYFYKYICHGHFFLCNYLQHLENETFKKNSQEIIEIIFNLFKKYQDYFICKDKKTKIHTGIEGALYGCTYWIIYMREVAAKDQLYFIYGFRKLIKNFPLTENVALMYNNYIFTPFNLWLSCNKIKDYKNDVDLVFMEEEFSEFIIGLWFDLIDLKNYFPIHIYWDESWFNTSFFFCCEYVEFESKNHLYISFLELILEKNVISVEEIFNIFKNIISSIHKTPYSVDNNKKDFSREDMYIMTIHYLSFLKKKVLKKYHSKNGEKNRFIFRKLLINLIKNLLVHLSDVINISQNKILNEEDNILVENLHSHGISNEKNEKNMKENENKTLSSHKEMYVELYKLTYKTAVYLQENKHLQEEDVNNLFSY